MAGKCLLCNRELPEGRSKYCCDSHLKQYVNIHLVNKREEFRERYTHCEICGSPLPRYKHKYCSDECERSGTMARKRQYDQARRDREKKELFKKWREMA